MRHSLRSFICILLLTFTIAAQADKALLLREAPEGCEEKGEVSVSSGSKMQGMFFSDARIDSNVHKKLGKAIKKAGGNRGMISDRREFLMENHFRGIEHIELDAWVWHCEEEES